MEDQASEPAGEHRSRTTVVGAVASLALLVAIVAVATTRPVVHVGQIDARSPVVWSSGETPVVHVPLPMLAARCGSLFAPASDVYPLNTVPDGECARRRHDIWIAEGGLLLALAVVVLVTLLRPRRDPPEPDAPDASDLERAAR